MINCSIWRSIYPEIFNILPQYQVSNLLFCFSRLSILSMILLNTILHFIVHKPYYVQWSIEAIYFWTALLIFKCGVSWFLKCTALKLWTCELRYQQILVYNFLCVGEWVNKIYWLLQLKLFTMPLLVFLCAFY